MANVRTAFGQTLPPVTSAATIGGPNFERDSRPYVDVREYGARGDGGTDDTSAIQAAVNALGASGGTVFFPVTGAEYVVSTIFTADRVTFRGETELVTIKKLGGTTGSVFTQGSTTGTGGFRVTWQNMIIDGNRAACPAALDGIGQFVGSTSEGFYGDAPHLENVTVQNCARHGINLGRSASNIVLPYLRNVRPGYNGGRGIVARRWTDGWIGDSWIAENSLGNVQVIQCSAVRFRACQIEGNDDTAVSGLMGTTYPGIELSGGNRLIWIQGGCSFSSCRRAIQAAGDLIDCMIQGNWFNGNNSRQANGTNANIYLDPTGATYTNLVVSDNIFSSDNVSITGDLVSNRVSHHVFCVAAGTITGGMFYNNRIASGGGNPTTATTSLPAGFTSAGNL